MKQAKLSAYILSSKEPEVGSLMNKIRDWANANNAFAQAFSPDLVVSERHLFHAFLLASKAFKEKENYAKTLENEVLVKAAAEKRVNEAIKQMGVKTPKRFAFLTDARPREVESLLKEIKAKSLPKEFKPSKEKVLKAFCLDRAMLSNYPLEEMVLEAMAMSGVKR